MEQASGLYAINPPMQVITKIIFDWQVPKLVVDNRKAIYRPINQSLEGYGTYYFLPISSQVSLLRLEITSLSLNRSEISSTGEHRKLVGDEDLYQPKW